MTAPGPSTMNMELQVRLIKAKDLAAKDVTGKSDPFIKWIVDGKKKAKSKIVKQNLNPEWNETYYWSGCTERTVIRGEMWDHDLVGKDFMGCFQIDTADMMVAVLEPVEKWIPLQKRTSSDKVSGEVLINIQFREKPNANFDVNAARALTAEAKDQHNAAQGVPVAPAGASVPPPAPTTTYVAPPLPPTPHSATSFQEKAAEPYSGQGAPPVCPGPPPSHSEPTTGSLAPQVMTGGPPPPAPPPAPKLPPHATPSLPPHATPSHPPMPSPNHPPPFAGASSGGPPPSLPPGPRPLPSTGGGPPPLPSGARPLPSVPPSGPPSVPPSAPPSVPPSAPPSLPPSAPPPAATPSHHVPVVAPPMSPPDDTPPVPHRQLPPPVPPHPHHAPAAPSKPTVAATFDYQAANESELSLVVGNHYTYDKEEDGWYQGTDVLSGKFGWFPGNYTQKV